MIMIMKRPLFFSLPRSIGLLFSGFVAVLTLLYLGQSFAAPLINVNTSLIITTGLFTFSKDMTSSMSGYFVAGGYAGHITGNNASGINLGVFAVQLYEQAAYSSGDHRFTLTDIYGAPFIITLLATNMTGILSGVAVYIPGSAISYTGTAWVGTGSPLTNTGAVGVLSP
jgi:hypothetical protein